MLPIFKSLASGIKISQKPGVWCTLSTLINRSMLLFSALLHLLSYSNPQHKNWRNLEFHNSCKADIAFLKLMVYFKKCKKKCKQLTKWKCGLRLYLTGRKFWLETSLFHFLGLQAYPYDLWYQSILVISLLTWNVVSSTDLNAAPLALFHRPWVPAGRWFLLALTASHRVSTKCEESDQQTFHLHCGQWLAPLAPQIKSQHNHIRNLC